MNSEEGKNSRFSEFNPITNKLNIITPNKKETQSQSGGASIEPSIIEAGAPPNPNNNEVAITFISPEHNIANAVGLGAQEVNNSKIITKYIPSDAYTDVKKYQFNTHGFECIDINELLLEPVMNSIVTTSRTISTSNRATSTNWTNKDYQDAIDKLQEFIKNKYYELTGIENIQVVASRHLIFRIAGSTGQSNQIPGNPLTHLDYNNFENAQNKQCETYPGNHNVPQVNCPKSNSKMIDFVNIWFPTNLVEDWPLGFIVGMDDNNADIPISDYKTIEIVSGSIAASIEPRDDIKVAYKKNMQPGEAYLFRSATQSTKEPDTPDNKKGLYHGSFRISNEPAERRSIELRFMIFQSISGGKKKTKKYNKIRRIKRSKKNKKRSIKSRK